MKVYFDCGECGKNYFRYYTNDGRTIPKIGFCSANCKGAWQSKNLNGENNPNFNVRWNADQRANLSAKVSLAMTPERRAEIGNQHRGKKMSKESIIKIHANRTPESYSRPHTEENKKKIGKKSADKFKTPGYLAKVRKVMEDRGYWVPLKDREAFDIYNNASEWIDSMFEHISYEKCVEINNVGMFNTKTNQKGYCRDHMFSRKDGFDNLVFPEILRHPCNCDFILHSVNSSKRSKSSKTLEQLFKDIENYCGEWHEHQRVLDLIGTYNLGLRWNIQQFIEEVYSV